MTGWDDVLELTDPDRPATTEDDLLVVASSTRAEAVIGLVQDWFGGDDARMALRLVLDGVDRGVLRRSAAYSLARTSDRGGLGSGDHAMLPGHSTEYIPLRLSCPAPGCRVRAAAVSYDPYDPPQCGVHHVALRVEG
ncbi:hypothetical protein [Nonomuraea jiangxiensis]|uniref:Uncharacterized protein n=1 Tax=Nonomuraea jiangxiensis TaxID=633440 RepID=A0A1G9P5N8_9ACTN|nr:hypothetical protein [Nonomuraea jiangxiensis]SDL94039.1 hypothetical protein SAMN05421869_13341 [Nonomuraea jiangxiensis]